MADGNIAQVDSLKTLTDLMGLFGGKTTSQTTSSNVSKEGMDAIIQQILSGTQGLAAVSSGQKSAGLYGSTTNQQLVNDLITRASGELAKQQAGTTVKTTQNGALAGKTGQLLQGAMLLKSLAKTETGKKITSKLDELITGNTSNGIANSVSSGGIPAGADPAAFTALEANLASGGSLAGADAISALGTDALSDSSVLALQNASAPTTAAAEESLASIASADAAASSSLSVPGVALAATYGNYQADLAQSNPAAAVDTFFPGVGSAAQEITGGWVICTELNAQGKLPTELYQASAQRALTLSANVMAGYHLWAIPFTRAMRRSATLSKLVAPIARSRCEYLLGKKRIWGWLTVVIGEPICEFLGSRMSGKQEDWRNLYGRA